MKKNTKEKITNKEIIIWFLILGFPILFALLIAGIKEEHEEDTKPNITKITYVHVFYVPNTDSEKEIGTLIEDMHLDCRIVYHNISEDGSLYQKVVEYFKLPMEIYNPLVAINDKVFIEINKEEIEETIKEQIDIYAKDNISSDIIATYNIVDRIAAKEEIVSKRS